MANFTRRAIKEAFTSLLEERPLNDITVKDIVERVAASTAIRSTTTTRTSLPSLRRSSRRMPSLSSRPTPPYPPLWRALMRSSNLPHAAAGPFWHIYRS